MLGAAVVLPQKYKVWTSEVKLQSLEIAQQAKEVAENTERERREIMWFLRRTSFDRSHTIVAQYTRTINVLDQCGEAYLPLRDKYEDVNIMVYKKHMDEISLRDKPSPKYVSTQGTNLDDLAFEMDAPEGKHEKAGGDSGFVLSTKFSPRNPFRKDVFASTPTQNQCEYIQTEINEGRLKL